ncbi:DUF3054 domain-containing protein [Conyzicola nivalis]|uniref:DUF3054 domain-containing protein n=1 Tax=Conyzicola nivalis TaxID=1477021 RepID=A0A916WIJ9_9MICO|nr:DUF3054 domain-containing protein [Conyzicola nivalis]GGB00640.1 hypothetical protein GCM10010979_13920 [Conyzicola nivalis]
MRPATRTALLAFLTDAAVVLVFVLIGRASHDEHPVLGALITYWPFFVALMVGWVLARAWKSPLAVLRSGVPIWVTTVALGMVLRVLGDQGVQWSFVIVTSVVLAVFLLGWRAVARLVTARRRARAS